MQSDLNIPQKIIDIAGEIISKLLGPAITEGGELFADKIRFVRFKNQISILNKVQKLLDENGLTPKQIPIKLSFPLFDNATLEEDPTLQEMWAELIMNASVSDYREGLHKVCISILSDLSPIEALVLESIKNDIIK